MTKEKSPYTKSLTAVIKSISETKERYKHKTRGSLEVLIAVGALNAYDDVLFSEENIAYVAEAMRLDKATVYKMVYYLIDRI